ncbi:MAG: TonB-dependent receptor [bacterium]
MRAIPSMLLSLRYALLFALLACVSAVRVQADQGFVTSLSFPEITSPQDVPDSAPSYSGFQIILIDGVSSLTLSNLTAGIQPSVIVEINDTESFELTASLSWHEQIFIDNGLPFLGGIQQQWQQAVIFRTRFDDHTLAISSTYTAAQYEPDNLFFIPDMLSALLPDNLQDSSFGSVESNWTEFSLFAEDTWKPNDSLTFSMGLRYDRFGRDDTSFISPGLDADPVEEISPSFAAAYHNNDGHNLSVSYQQGFDRDYYRLVRNSSPMLTSTYGFDVVKPETVDSYELNYTWDITVGFSLGVSVFHDEIEDQYELGQLPGQWAQDTTGADAFSSIGMNQYQNLEKKSKAVGSELIVRYQVLQNTSTNMSYGYIDTKETTLQTRPVHQVRMGITSYFFKNRLSVGGNYFLNTSLHDKSAEQPVPYSEDQHFVDIFATYRITERWSGKFIVENLLQTDADRLQFTTSVPFTSVPNQRRVYFSITRY